MSKNESLLKQAEIFEKLARYGSRKEFLASLAQNLSNGAVSFPDENIANAIKSAGGSIKGLAQLLGQSGSASTPEGGVLEKIGNMLDNYVVPSYVNDKGELDSKASPVRSLLANAMATCFQVRDGQFPQEAKEAAQQIISEVKMAIDRINTFYRNNGLQVEDFSAPTPAAGPASTAPQAAKTQVNPTDAAKNLAKALEASVDKLTTGPERTAQLQRIENTVKTLQNYFRTSQKSGGLQGYFARMEIVSALQKLYSALEYADLDVVKSLNAGRGVPETPDSKI
jgi:hypothetical protein